MLTCEACYVDFARRELLLQTFQVYLLVYGWQVKYSEQFSAIGYPPSPSYPSPRLLSSAHTNVELFDAELTNQSARFT